MVSRLRALSQALFRHVLRSGSCGVHVHCMSCRSRHVFSCSIGILMSMAQNDMYQYVTTDERS